MKKRVCIIMGARYYIPWLCRWAAVDPLESKYSPQSPYNYGNSNPITWSDPTGMGGEKHDEGQRRVVPNTELSEDGIRIPGKGIEQYWHNGDENNKSGWYSEKQYLDITKSVMIGLLHAFGKNATGELAMKLSFHTNLTSDTLELQEADRNAYSFLNNNEGAISSDFFNLLFKEAVIL